MVHGTGARLLGLDLARSTRRPDVEAISRLTLGSLLHDVRKLVCKKAFAANGVRLIAPVREHHVSSDRVCIGVHRIS